mmetsp:Transcript_88278/g.189525  ORF Transcript_88278/g.189525 Transcript_88278/m.189525 type:complete len:273 (-) Transcript_88278:77-895(-)
MPVCPLGPVKICDRTGAAAICEDQKTGVLVKVLEKNGTELVIEQKLIIVANKGLVLSVSLVAVYICLLGAMPCKVEDKEIVLSALRCHLRERLDESLLRAPLIEQGGDICHPASLGQVRHVPSVVRCVQRLLLAPVVQRADKHTHSALDISGGWLRDLPIDLRRLNLGVELGRCRRFHRRCGCFCILVLCCGRRGCGRRRGRSTIVGFEFLCQVLETFRLSSSGETGPAKARLRAPRGIMSRGRAIVLWRCVDQAVLCLRSLFVTWSNAPHG